MKSILLMIGCFAFTGCSYVLESNPKTLDQRGVGMAEEDNLSPPGNMEQQDNNTFSQSNFTSIDGKDLGGTLVGESFSIEWKPGAAPIEPIISGMIVRLEHLQKTTSGSTTNQKKLFELVDLERKLKTIKDDE